MIKNQFEVSNRMNKNLELTTLSGEVEVDGERLGGDILTILPLYSI